MLVKGVQGVVIAVVDNVVETSCPSVLSQSRSDLAGLGLRATALGGFTRKCPVPGNASLLAQLCVIEVPDA